MNETDEKTTVGDEGAERRDERCAYEAPKMLKKRSVERVTLFSGAGGHAAGTGLTAA